VGADPAEVQRTIPRGTSADPEGDAPAVDPALWELHLHHQRCRCDRSLATLVEEYESYALALARRYHRDGEQLDDLEQVAREALVTALQRFDCERRTPFPGFAKPTIVGSLKRHYRDQGWALRVPRRVHELAGPAKEAAEQEQGRLGRPPTAAEVAGALGVTETEIEQVRTATHARSVVSVDAPSGRDALPLEVPTTDPGLRAVEERVDLVDALRTLDERARTVVGLYYFEGLNQDQIAERYGVSQMQVSRWIRSALLRLRRRTATADVRPGWRSPTVVGAA
jgi:RNA polymerase sigma-B factor